MLYPQLQMEKLSSREAIAELMTWLDHVEQQQGHEEPINAQCSAVQVRSLLQKYKVNGKLQVQAFCKVSGCNKDGNSLQALSYPSPCSQEGSSNGLKCVLTSSFIKTFCFHAEKNTACNTATACCAIIFSSCCPISLACSLSLTFRL